MTPPINDDNFGDEERLLWKGGFSARSMFGASIGAILVTVVLVLAVYRIEPLRENRLVGWTMLGIIALIWLGLIGLVAYRKFAKHYEITSLRLKHRNGIFLRKIDRIEMIDIDDVSYRQGPLQAIMDVGTILLVSSDASQPNLTLAAVSNVSNVAGLIDEARREERRKRGLPVVGN